MGASQGGQTIRTKTPGRNRRQQSGFFRRTLAAAGHAGPLAWGLLAISVLWFWGLVWSLNPLATIQASLLPHPDGAEYVDMAVNLIEGNGAGIHVGGETRPSRYPPGYSVVLAVAMLLGVGPVEAPYLVNKVAGLVLVLSVFLITSRAGGVAAGLAVLLLVTRSSFVVLARSPMSEVVAGVAVLWGVVYLYDYARRRDRWRGAAGCLLLAAAASCRTALLPLLALAPLAWWLRADLLERERRADLVRGIAVIVAALAPLLIYNTAVFGAPWRTGYGFWLPQDSWAFSGSRLSAAVAMLWQELTQAQEVSTASSYGEGSFLAPAFAVVVLLALEPLLQRRELRCFAVVAGLYSAAVLLYAFPLARLLFPVVLLAIPPVAAATVERMELLNRRRRWAPLAASSLLLAAAIAGWPGTRSDTDLGDLARSHSLGWPTPGYDGVKLVEAYAGEHAWLLLTDANPPFAHAVSRGDRLVAPIQDDHDYGYRPDNFVFGAKERQRLVDAALRSGRRVYAATTQISVDRLPLPTTGYRWEILTRHSEAAGGVARLVEEP